MKFRAPATLAGILLLVSAPLSAQVAIVQTPAGGIQPRAAVDSAGVVHLVYFIGDAARGDLRYVRSSDGAKTFDAPLPVNQRAGTAMAVGNIRGAQIAIGRDARVHVAWNGSAAKEGEPAPMLYTRLDASAKSFEPERDVIGKHYGLDGGGAVAADGAGNVYVVWHAPSKSGQNEQARQVWVACSHDDGKTFAEEIQASSGGLGVCPCCGLGALALDDGGLAIVYRCAKNGDERDTTLLLRKNAKSPFEVRKLDSWKVAACVMSNASLVRGPRGPLAAWETQGKVRFAALDETGPHAPAANERNCKHPSIAINAAGDVVLSWSEDIGWDRPGTLAWQRFGADGSLKEGSLDAGVVPKWSLSSAIALADGRFVIFR